MVNLQVFVLLPPLEQPPDQMASRPLVTLKVIDVPMANDAEPLAPVATLMPAGAELTRSPLRPVAVTVRTAFWGGGGDEVTVRVADRVVPL